MATPEKMAARIAAERLAFSPIEREYTLSQINWKRSLTDVDMKRRKAAEKERSRLQFDVIKQISNPTLRFELEQFKLFGNLKKVDTEVHNTIPSLQTVSAEKDYIEFEQNRRQQPHAVQYRDIYTSMRAEADKPRTPSSRNTVTLTPLSSRRGGDKSPFRSHSVQKNTSSLTSSFTSSSVTPSVKTNASLPGNYLFSSQKTHSSNS